MARYNSIYAGPTTNPTPHAMEALASVDLLPGTIVVLDGAEFDPAAATTTGKVWVVQDNYLTGRGISNPWPSGSRTIALDLVPGQFFRALVPTGNDLVEGDALTPGANGKLVKAGSSDMVVGTAAETYNNNTGEDQLVSFKPAAGYMTPA